MYISISRYAGVAGKIGEAAPKVQQGFVPMLKNQPGFLGYAALATEQGDVVSLHIWETSEALTNSRDKIRTWVYTNTPGFAEPTERFQGEVGQHAVTAPQSGGQGQSLYCMVRKSQNLPGGDAMVPVVKEMIAAAQKVNGFRGAYFARSGDDPTRGGSVLFFDNREHTGTAHEATLAIMRQQQPDVTIRVAASGTTSVLAMA